MKGSTKQIAWAEDIIEEAQAALDCMDRNIDRLGEMSFDTLNFTHEDVTAVRNWLNGQLAMIDNASDIIKVRGQLSQTALEKLAANHNKLGY